MYRQIMEQIKRRVAVGDWLPGEQLPSIRELAAAVRVSVITIKRVYLELEREGVIVTQQGKGSFVAEDLELSQKLHEQELEVHLQNSVRVASILGLDPQELQERLAHIYKSRNEDTE
ncbi:MAG: GntR family transcriptional regulator [Thermoanaerobaculia bacterium]|nr:GntR family transcriptional regulator [Thermoanaerobaculia bacterium]